MDLKPGTKIKIKSLEDLLKITGIKTAMENGNWQVKLPSGLYFRSWMLGLYGGEFFIESVTQAGAEGTELKEPSYSLKGSRGNVWVTQELFYVVE